ncbi:MAG: Glu/Leu/Phe/Val dehydrogenase dimerization domain-containing protein [Pseudomonadota bacterium]
MESLLKEWNGESVIIRFDRGAEAWIVIAIHSTALGPAVGGTRMKPYARLEDALEDAQRLAGGMTLKWSAAGIDYGGGKAVIAVQPDMDSKTRAELLRRYGAFVHRHNGLFFTGPDYGTSSEDMDIIAETGDPYIFGRTPAAGGAGNPAPFTALGVFTSIQVAAGHAFGSPALEGKQVLIQGVGSVGRELVALLLGSGSKVLISDVNEAALERFRKEAGLESIAPDEVYERPCDIFVPCAVGGVLNQKTIPLLHCRAVVGAANNQLGKPEDAERLRRREILYAPDFIANSGGAIAIIGTETGGWSKEEAEERLVKLIKDNLSRIFEMAETEGCSTDEAAQHIAEMRLTASE